MILLKIICLVLYYSIAYYLPNSYSPFGGKFFNRIRVLLVKVIAKKVGKISTVNRCVDFGNGRNLEIGDYSGLGENAKLPNDIVIGRYVMMASDCVILSQNHNFSDINTPMCFQGSVKCKRTIIEDDVWIGQNVMMTPGRYIKKGSIIAMGTVLCKDFPEYSIIGGNPSRLIRSRKEKAD